MSRYAMHIYCGRGLARAQLPGCSKRSNKLAIAFALALSCFGTAFPAAISEGAPQASYPVAAWKIRWQIDLQKVECVSFIRDRATIFGKDTRDEPRVKEIVGALWPRINIYQDDASCPNVFGFSVHSQLTRSVTLGGKPAAITMAFQVCGRKPDTSIDDKRCSYKNIYLFEREHTPLETFEFGLKAFLLPQESAKALFNIQVNRVRR